MSDLKTFQEANKREPKSPEELDSFENKGVLLELKDRKAPGSHKAGHRGHTNNNLMKLDPRDGFRWVDRKNARRLVASGKAVEVDSKDKDYEAKSSYARGEHRKPKEEGKKDGVPSVQK